MFKRILVPVDGSESARKALVAALQLARDAGGRVRLLQVFEQLYYLPSHDLSIEALKLAEASAHQVLDDAAAVAASAGVPADTRCVEALGTRLGEIVAHEARRWEADLVVVGTHGRRGVGRVLLGSGAEQIIRLAPVPVLVFRDQAAATP